MVIIFNKYKFTIHWAHIILQEIREYIRSSLVGKNWYPPTPWTGLGVSCRKYRLFPYFARQPQRLCYAMAMRSTATFDTQALSAMRFTRTSYAACEFCPPILPKNFKNYKKNEEIESCSFLPNYVKALCQNIKGISEKL